MELRQKSINLIYLILLALLFNYIPADYLDGIAESESGINLLKADVERLGYEKRSRVLHELQAGHPIIYEETSEKLAKIDQSTRAILESIQEIKFQILEKSGDPGDPDLSSPAISNEIMIAEGNAQHLFHALRAHKDRIKSLIRAEYVDEVDSILPTPRTIGRSNGTFHRFESYYFQGKPVSIALLNIALLAARVERLRTFSNDVVLGIHHTGYLAGAAFQSGSESDLLLVPNSKSSMGGTLKVSELKRFRKLEMDSHDRKILHFKFSVRFADGFASMQALFNQGAEFSEAVLQALKQVRPGDVLEFREIWIEEQNGSRQMSETISVRVN